MGSLVAGWTAPMALDASAIDEGTMMDRDWYWVFNGLWDKKSTDRCRVTIADTIICSGGEPQQWMFTAKNGVVKRMGKEKVKWPTIREKLIQMQEAHNARWNYMTGQNRSLDYGYVAVCRSGAPGSFEVTRLDRQGFEVSTCPTSAPTLTCRPRFDCAAELFPNRRR